MELPEYIVEDIFKLLPMKSLLRCKRVCKSWYRLITSWEFSKLHFHYCRANNEKVLISEGYEDIRILDLNHELSLVEQLPQYLYPWKKLELDDVLKTSDNNNPPIFWNFCDGLACKSCPDGSVSLWNPCTGSILRTPKPIMPSGVPPESWKFSLYGFGYDSSIHNYKVVRFALTYYDNKYIIRYPNYFLHPFHLVSEIQVYNAKDNSWKIIENIPYYYQIQSGKRAILLNEALHYAVIPAFNYTGDSCYMILSFTLATEKIQEIKLILDNNHEIRKPTAEAANLGGYLSLGLCYSDRLDLWFMKEYGRINSWSKLVSISLPPIHNNFVMSWLLNNNETFDNETIHNNFVVSCLLNNNETLDNETIETVGIVLIRDSSELYVYENHTLKCVHFIASFLFAFRYVESLVSPHQGEMIFELHNR